MIDVAILGAGAAGLLAAKRAAERGRKVLLLERNKKPGVKILMSGGTRCNVTHDGSPAEVAKAFGKRSERFLRPSMLAFSPADMIALLEKLDVPLKTEPPHGKVFPRSDRATDVLAALVNEARAKGATLRTEARVLSVDRVDSGFLVKHEGGEVAASRVIIATGGQSYPKAGFTGDGYGLARAFGHSISTPRPALVPLVLGQALEGCSGVSLTDTRLALAPVGGKLLAERRGELLFTHRGLSGPAALDLSGELTARTSGVVRDATGPFEVALDLLPRVGHEDLQAELARKSSRSVATLLHERELPRSLVRALLLHATVPEERTLQEIRREERAAVVRALKDLRLPVTGTTGFDKAEVTAGGVVLDEVEPATLESRKVRGLHFIGEVLDVDGPVGGYNFQAAWSTGWAAGSAV
ncbi:MAG TPA: NAD(P)/FAD-dependent oxidoreductase [Planctomycetota bacterium]|nr:NAD(P)/FAD-dependent oxidoreductase [Planctomycetota bacterium]